ncbi:MAG: alpha-L-fucosidase [Phycisphaerales bacterium]|nr:alpha-L-fucosidase [Phycisphaerales bacterium]
MSCALAALSLTGGAAAARDHAGDHDRRMGWFRDARFGMFIHWGLYAIPGGRWDGTDVPGAGEWILNSAKIDPAKYTTLQQQFNPVEFNADEWVRIAKAAGQRYIVITSKHHDGFCLWNSAATEFDVAGSPFKRDILKELASACERGGITLCFYHSIMDWTHPDYLPRRAWDPRNPDDADLDRYVGYMKSQLRELISGRYGKIVILWFDGEWEDSWTHERGMDLARFVRGIDPDIIINNRVDKGRSGMAGLDGAGEWAGDYGTPEQEIPSTGLAGLDLETCMTMNGTWGFSSADENWKSARQLVRDLCDIASKGGNFLLNVGPQSDGRIPAASIERLACIGVWMETNGESIYGTSASPFRQLPWGRCTQKPLPGGATRLYFHVFDWPSATANGTNSLSIPGLESAVTSARLLGATAFEATARRVDGGWSIAIPVAAPDTIASVIAVDIEGSSKVTQLAQEPQPKTSTPTDSPVSTPTSGPP